MFFHQINDVEQKRESRRFDCVNANNRGQLVTRDDVSPHLARGFVRRRSPWPSAHVPTGFILHV